MAFLSLSDTESLIIIISLIVNYFISVTIAGTFKAWVSNRLGDPTARILGFMAFDPLMHYDAMGLVFLVLLRIGWGQTVPVDFTNFKGDFKKIRFSIAVFSEIIFYLLLALMALTTVFVLVGRQTVMILSIQQAEVIHLASSLLKYNPGTSSLTITLSLFLATLFNLNIKLSVLNFFINGIQLITTLSPSRSLSLLYLDLNGRDLAATVAKFIILFTLFYFLFPVVYLIFNSFVLYSAATIASLITVTHR